MAGKIRERVNTFNLSSNAAVAALTALYCAPSCASEGVLRVDPAAGTTSVLPLPAGVDAKKDGKWMGGLVPGGDGALYCAPYNAAEGVLRGAGAGGDQQQDQGCWGIWENLHRERRTPRQYRGCLRRNGGEGGPRI